MPNAYKPKTYNSRDNFMYRRNTNSKTSKKASVWKKKTGRKPIYKRRFQNVRWKPDYKGRTIVIKL